MEMWVRVQVLGGFEVIDGGSPAVFGSRRAAQLVKVLAVGGGALAVDVVVEALWPDDAPGAGRARLRNVLARVRAASPALVVRRAEELAFGPGVTVDLLELEREARLALGGGAPGRAAAAVAAAGRALRLYGGELLPGDPYAPWAYGARERVRRRVLDLVDLVVTDAVDCSEPHRAVPLLEHALELDPTAEDRRLLVIRLLAAGGRRASVERHLRAARAVADDLGVDLAAPLRSLEAARCGV